MTPLSLEFVCHGGARRTPPPTRHRPQSDKRYTYTDARHAARRRRRRRFIDKAGGKEGGRFIYDRDRPRRCRAHRPLSSAPDCFSYHHAFAAYADLQPAEHAGLKVRVAQLGGAKGLATILSTHLFSQYHRAAPHPRIGRTQVHTHSHTHTCRGRQNVGKTAFAGVYSSNIYRS